MQGVIRGMIDCDVYRVVCNDATGKGCTRNASAFMRFTLYTDFTGLLFSFGLPFRFEFAWNSVSVCEVISVNFSTLSTSARMFNYNESCTSFLISLYDTLYVRARNHKRNS